MCLDSRALAALHPALQRRALRRAYALAAGDLRTLSESHLDSVLNLVRNRRGGRRIDLPRGILARSEGDFIRMASKSAEGGGAQWVPLCGEYSIRVPREADELVEADVDGWRLSMQAGSHAVLKLSLIHI